MSKAKPNTPNESNTEYLTAAERRRIDADPFLSVADVVDHRRQEAE